MFTQAHHDTSIIQDNGIQDQAAHPSAYIEERVDHYEVVAVLGGQTKRIKHLRSFSHLNAVVVSRDELLYLAADEF